MSNFPYVFLADKFREDLQKETDRTSTRHLSSRTENKISPSKISRIQTGKQSNFDISDFLDLCSAMKQNPMAYLQRQLL